MTKCLCVILARSGSKRIKDKNIKLFNNKPLFYYSILFAKTKLLLMKFYLGSTHRYLNFKKIWIKNLSQRPKKYSQDNSKSFDTLKYEINKFEKKIKKI